MPANKKYLTKSPVERIAKVTAAFFGGYLVSVSFHLALAAWLDHVNVIITMTYNGFILWAVLMILAFLAKNPWKVWGLYILLTAVFYAVLYFGKLYNPILLL